MAYEEILPRRGIPRNEMLKRGVLSRFGEQAYYKIVGGAIFVASGSEWHPIFSTTCGSAVGSSR